MKRALFVLGFVCAVASGQKSDPAKSFPVAERAAIRMLEKANAQGNAVLYVEFERDKPAARVITVKRKAESTTYRDDGIAPDEKAGDGVHSAFIRLDHKQFQEQQKRLPGASLPLFVGRELVGTAPAPPPALTAVEPFYPLVNSSSINAAKSLFITDPSVINDSKRTWDPCRKKTDRGGIAMGKWTFGHLMAEMADRSGHTRDEFVRKWLANWQNVRRINSFDVAARPEVANRTLGQWPTINGKLDLSEAPFKLLAIVNRIDMAEPLWTSDGMAGEARFIFTLRDGCESLRFLVIFEYKVNLKGCEAVKAWAEQWKRLDGPFVNDAQRNAALEAITVQFTEGGTTPLQQPNGSSLAQLRTNELLETKPWELREFHLDSGPESTDGYLVEDTVKQTPDIAFDRTAALRSYAQANRTSIVADDYTVPLQLADGTPFLGGDAPVQGDDTGGADTTAIFYWAFDSLSQPVAGLRHHLSLNTCNGCHGAETGTKFAHVNEFGELSKFLTGITIRDVGGETSLGVPVKRTFNDLARREQRLAQILDRPCPMDVFHRPFRMTH